MTNQVKVKITGKNPNTFLQELIKKRINIYEFEKEEHSITIRIDQDDWQILKKMKTTYKMKILSYYGIARVKYLIKKYYFFLLVFLLGIGMNYFLSTRIWRIEIVNPNQKIVNLVKKDLQKLGLKKYEKKVSYLQKEWIKKKILEKEKDDLEWIEIEEIGSKYIVKVEQRKKNQQEEICLPRNIVAKKNAIILEIKAQRGEIISKKNDYVDKGQPIISGWIHNKEDIVSKKCALGTIYGEVWYRMKISIPKERIITTFTSKKKKGISLTIGKKDYNINQKFRTYQKKEYNIIEEQIIPLKLSITEFLETKLKKKPYQEKEIEEIALDKVNQTMKKRLKKGEKILEKKVLKKTVINSKIEVDIFLTVKEDITDYEDISKIEIEKREPAKE